MIMIIIIVAIMSIASMNFKATLKLEVAREAAKCFWMAKKILEQTVWKTIRNFVCVCVDMDN